MSIPKGRGIRVLGLLAVSTALAACWASAASAVIVKFSSGRAYSYQPLRGAAIRLDSHFGNMDYGGGPVMPSNTDYLFFWSPRGLSAYPAEYPTGLAQYLKDLAHDSGNHQNVDSVIAQYNDSSGAHSAYNVKFGGTLVDTNPYPASACPAVAPTTHCLDDAQLQAELSKYLNAHHLPRDLTHQYFIMSAPHVENCFDANPNPGQPGGPYGGCSAGESINPLYCAYHTNSNISPVFIYSNDPYVTGNFGCDDGHHPNGPSDGALQGGFSHEHSESITDPLPNSTWTNWSAGGGEVGDQCGGIMGTPLGNHNGSPYNQLINGHFYWYQTEWSNQGHTCLQRLTPAGTAPGASFTATSGAGRLMHFNSSASGGGIADFNWQWSDNPGDHAGTETTATTVSHTFKSAGLFAVGLTTFTANGTSTGTSNLIATGHNGFARGFTFTPSSPAAGSPVTFTAVNKLDGLSLNEYVWNFGDGSPAASGASPHHTFAAPGSYHVSVVLVGGNVLTISTAILTRQTISVH